MRTLENKVVLITGAGSGFGRVLALEVANRKAIPILADVNAEGLAETAKLLDQKGARYGKRLLDIRRQEDWEAAASAIVAEFGGIDVLVNNAGVLSRAESFLELTEEHCRFIFEVNFWGMYHGVRALVPYLAKRPEAHIVNTSSSLALIGSPMHSIYCASKAAVANYTAVLREELSQTNISVTTVFPGASRTNLGRNVPADSREQQETNAKNFDKFATTPPEVVVRKILAAILHRRPIVITGVDGKAMGFLQRLAPTSGYKIMAAAYRKISDPKLFTRLNQLKNP